MERVKLHCKDETYEGVLIPSEDDKFLVLKLDNGYNIGLKKSRVSKIEKLGKVKKKLFSKKPVKQSSKKEKITVLNVGGTITSKVDYETGGVTAKFDPEELLEMFPELRDIANIDARLVRNIMSDNMRFDHYNLIAKEIEKEVKKGVKGVIVTHGTDTLHYTSAALSFALEGLPIPIVLVGSQRSSDRPSTDSPVNLISAAVFITNTKCSGVFTCMHENNSDDTCLIIQGTKVRKMHTSRRDAFRPINTTPVAVVDYSKKKVKEVKKINSSGDFKASLFNPKLKIGLFKFHAHTFADELDSYSKFDGLVLEAFALGQAQIVVQDEYMKEHEKIKKKVASLAKKIPVAVASQCIYGRVDMNVYSEGRALLELGVLGNNTDMTPETAFVKLAWLISNKKDLKLYSENLRGEISDFTEKETFLV